MERREFLHGALGAPVIVPGSALGLNGAVAPSERIHMGFIGAGGMGGGHVRAFSAQPDVRGVAICDVRKEHRDRAKQVVDTRNGDTACATYNDFREMLARDDIDAVLIAVPDHWHVLVGLEAARRRKDMYYEKPLGMSLTEDKAMRRAVHRGGVIFQFGTQQRSDQRFRLACELVRNGRLGQLRKIVLAAASFTQVPNQPAEPVPPGFDYDMWLGPAPWAPHCNLRCTRQFTLLYDYSLGCVGGAWGIHDADIAQWAMDADRGGPVEVEGAGQFPRDGFYDTAPAFEVEHRYANGVRLIFADWATARKHAPQMNMIRMGLFFEGTEGWIAVSREGIFTHPEKLARTVFGSGDVRLPRSNDHRRNFLDSVRKRTQPISHLEAAVRSDTVCHQADIAMRLARKLRWDPLREEFTGDEQANRMLVRPMRGSWHLGGSPA
ncbi:MAG: Gfo/Idh/MocA family oxidoreductase [Acidobacteria bacterium]|nr:Gfo/Idh/MocA family oxidoreductase [Acidobacteriota bacterium]